MNTLELQDKAKLNWHVSGDELLMVDQCVERFHRICREHKKELAIVETMMDIIICHTQNYKLNFTALLLTSDGDFANDIIGIIKHIDRSTGKLQNGFIPRNIIH